MAYSRRWSKYRARSNGFNVAELWVEFPWSTLNNIEKTFSTSYHGAKHHT